MDQAADAVSVVIAGSDGLAGVGLRSLLEQAGMDVVAAPGTDEALAAVEAVDADALLLVLGEGVGQRHIRRLRGESPETPLVAVCGEAGPEASAEMLRAGATTVVTHACAPRRLVRVVRAALHGDASLPSSLVAWLAARAAPETFATDTEVRWLGELAAGRTVAQLANGAGYSERSMYRLLHGLYGRLGVSDRHAAVAALRQRGLLDAGVA